MSVAGPPLKRQHRLCPISENLGYYRPPRIPMRREYMRREYRIRFIALELLVLVLLCSGLLHAQAGQNGSAVSGPADALPAHVFDLEAARRYEKQSRWKEAEQEYLQAGRTGEPWVKEEALAALDRLGAHRSADYENFDFELGKMYEDDHKWKDAEQHYVAAAKDAPKPVRDRLLLDVERVRKHLWLEEFSEAFDRCLGYIARALGVLFVLVIIGRIWKTRRGIQVMPFEAPTDDAIKRVVFSLSSAREELPNLLAPVFATMGSNVVDVLPLIILPGVENEFPDPAEDLEIGEVKIPLANWIRLINRPMVRVSGRWNVGQNTGTVQARILRRRFPSSYRESRIARSTLDSAATDARDRRLALFGYDVLVKAIYTRRYGP